MSPNQLVWLATLAVGVVQLQSAALAEESLRADTPRLDTTTPVKRAPLSGKVSVHTAHVAPAPHKSSSLLHRLSSDKVSVAKVAAPKTNLNASASSFRGAPMQGTLDRNRDLMRGFTQDFSNHNPYAMRAQAEPPKSTNPDDAPYRWAQSGSGGYYDASGTYKGPFVWGDKIGSYGGRFYDGTPVPKGEVKVNAMGHIWWQDQLSQNFVKREQLRKQGMPY